MSTTQRLLVRLLAGAAWALVGAAIAMEWLLGIPAGDVAEALGLALPGVSLWVLVVSVPPQWSRHCEVHDPHRHPFTRRLRRPEGSRRRLTVTVGPSTMAVLAGAFVLFGLLSAAAVSWAVGSAALGGLGWATGQVGDLGEAARSAWQLGTSRPVAAAVFGFVFASGFPVSVTLARG